MLSKFGKIALILIVGMSILGLYLAYSMSSFREDARSQVAQEALRTAVLASRDDSARVDEGVFKLNKPAFEAYFMVLFHENQVGHAVDTFEFEYLAGQAEDSVLAIRVILIGDDHRDEVTTVLSVSDE